MLPQNQTARKRWRRLLYLFSCLLLSGPGSATASTPPETRVTAFLLAPSHFPAKEKSQVMNILSKALKKNARLDVKDSDRLLVEFAGEIPEEALGTAREALSKGIALLHQGEPEKAIPLLQEAIRGLEEVLPFIKKEELARAFMALGAAQGKSGQPRQAISTFITLQIWRPGIPYDVALFTTEPLPLFEKAKTAVTKLKRGSVELFTEPPGAHAYIDGRRVGITPAIAFGLTVGEHYTTFKLQGYIKAAQKVRVSPVKQLKYTQTLRRSEKYLLLEQSLNAAQRSLGQKRAITEMISLSALLFVDQVIFATLKEASGSSLAVEAYLYDLRSKLLLSTSSLTVKKRNLKELQQLARLLYLNVRYDGTLAEPPLPPPPPPLERRPFYLTWWFWTAVAAGAASVTMPILLWPEAKTWPEGSAVIHVQN